MHGLYWLVAALTEDAPRALVVDDAHLADASSLRVPRADANAVRRVNRSPSASGDFRSWRGLIGPFAVNSSNADGGPIAVTAHGVYRDGSERTVTATWSLEPCRR